jgi:hypothetical protein
MTPPTSPPPPAGFYRAVEVAAVLHCSEWWIKEQARRRRIPYSWIGGSYLFTTGHIAEIVRRFEVEALDGPVGNSASPPRPRIPARPDGSVVVLRARPPRRMRGAPDESTAA